MTNKGISSFLQIIFIHVHGNINWWHKNYLDMARINGNSNYDVKQDLAI